MTTKTQQHPPRGAYDYLLKPLRDDVWQEYPPSCPPPQQPPRPTPWLRRQTRSLPQPPQQPPRPPRVCVNIEIVHGRQAPPPRARLDITVVVARLALAVLLLFLLMLASAKSEQRWTSYQQGFETLHQSDDGWNGRSYRQGFMTYFDATGPGGATQHCHSYKQGWQTITECQ